MTVLISFEPEDLSDFVRHPYAEVEELVEIVGEEPEIRDGPNPLIRETVARVDWRVGDFLVNNNPPVGRLLHTDVGKTRR